jgi:hypothetical protein
LQLESKLGPVKPDTVVATWGMRESGGIAAADELRPVGEPVLFARRELLLYTSTAEP